MGQRSFKIMVGVGFIAFARDRRFSGNSSAGEGLEPHFT